MPQNLCMAYDMGTYHVRLPVGVDKRSDVPEPHGARTHLELKIAMQQTSTIGPLAAKHLSAVHLTYTWI
jgi:hypothetical protein